LTRTEAAPSLTSARHRSTSMSNSSLC
jgi:hypothetical protein